MNNNDLVFLQILKTFINQTSPELEDVTFDWDGLLQLAKIHDVSAIIGSQLLLTPMKDQADYKNTFLQLYATTVMRTIRISEAQETLNALFGEAGIDLLYFKGTVIAEHYPMPELRTMGDIDVLVRLEDRERAIALLMEQGAVEIEHSVDVSEYIFNGVAIEIHTNMIHEEIQTDFAFRDFFASAWNNAVPTATPTVWQLDPTFHLIYVIVHLAKHFHDRGCGVRMFMDVAILLEKQKEALDFAELLLQLKRMHLDRFFARLLFLNGCWFGQTSEIPEEKISEEAFAHITEYVISGGVFGYYGTPEENVALRKLYHQNQGASVKISGAKLILQTVFPNYVILEKLTYVSFLQNRKWLVPVAWVYRWIYCLMTKSKTVIRRIRTMSNISDMRIQQIQKQEFIIKEMGL